MINESAQLSIFLIQDRGKTFRELSFNVKDRSGDEVR